MAEHIGFIFIDPAIEAKIIDSKHNVTPADARSAFLWPARVQGFWEDHPLHGWRYVVKGHDSAGRVILGWLQPVDATDGTWALRSARAGT